MSTPAIKEILAKFDLREADFARIRAAAPVLKKDLDAFIEDFYRWMSAHREYQIFFDSNPARLVAIADVFDALMSRRAYKEAWTPDQVRAEMERSKGTHFDPELVDLFLAEFDEYCLIHSTIRE